jgi:TATA-box binding protein (TBP) (component of TFIID and TFIIIB)
MDVLREELLQKLQIAKLPNEVKISTITIVCKLPVLFNCENIASYFTLSKNGILTLIYGTFGNIKTNRSIVKIKKNTKTKKKKKNFFNQVSIAVRSPSKAKPVNVKLFTNGSIQMTGCTCVEDFFAIINILFKELKKEKAIMDPETKKITDKPYVNDISKVIGTNISNIKIAMINSNFRVDMHIDRQKLYDLLVAKKYYCFYDPLKHACVNIKYEHEKSNHQISIFVFEKGAIIITGARNCEQINDAYIFINKFLLENNDDIKKNDTAIEALLTSYIERMSKQNE